MDSRPSYIRYTNICVHIISQRKGNNDTDLMPTPNNNHNWMQTHKKIDKKNPTKCLKGALKIVWRDEALETSQLQQDEHRRDYKCFLIFFSWIKMFFFSLIAFLLLTLYSCCSALSFGTTRKTHTLCVRLHKYVCLFVMCTQINMHIRVCLPLIAACLPGCPPGCLALLQLKLIIINKIVERRLLWQSKT